ncbi:cysteine--tRNA ligase [Archaeoglobus fulgidus]|jgi:cysteinyl-tRNA synthetase|uniref:Cysteine--tRNA ligase n=2 Tax=Archaeoglobus fulgidus TaxID=2234 RepID=A0A075WA07_ARCFL|nr:cysteine--tRNA ligase [Archaeoglobus fulgidus]AIG97230.1 cysteinyl-tRNA synthetase [Archaeoglobus fulgidus DSM 8774]KUJ94386.1 MAG: Cysteine--tRNA ligase [Archaeoglobus fulgidus]KUK06543.1 MAG: Cysteine--tRNA ligase [Archaeoglobus fulgidus]
MEVYNTLSRKIEKLEDIVDGKRVKMYVCGITAYDYSHIGHARSAVFFDVFRRYLEYLGYEVVYVQNFTDVDDKIINRAVKEGKTQKEVAEKFIEEYLKDMEALNVKKPTYQPKVTEHIPDIIEFIQNLIEKGYAYVIDGDVYFHVPAFEHYGELSKQSLEELNRHRIEPDERKRDVKDFALWKSAKEADLKAQAVFDSPWGRGRPGWHIECSVMSAKYLGVPFDIHGGGKDLIFPHHENERAQSFARFGVEPVKIWVHNDFIRIKGEKMSKSLGNIVRIRDVLQRYEGEVLRYFLLTAHYRSPLDYTEEALERAKRAYEYLRSALINLDMEIAYLKTFGDRKEGKQVDVEDYIRRFEEAMNRDLHTPDAIAVLHEFAGLINKSLYELSLNQAEELYEAFKRLCGVLGLFEKMERVPALSREDAEKVVERERARKERNFELADAIRDEFAKRGIRLIDTPKGTRWRVE